MAAADYDFSLDRTKIIKAALRKCRALGQAEVMSAHKQQTAIEALNILVKSWQNKGSFLWSETISPISTVAGQEDYDLATLLPDDNILSIDKAVINKDGIDVELEIKSYRDYLAIPDKTDSAESRAIAFDSRNKTLYFYQVPDAVYTVKLFTILRLKDFDLDAGGGDIKSNWYHALIFGLARSLCFEYPVPIGEKREIKDEADAAFLAAKNTEDRSNSDYRHADSAFPRRSFR